jgi:hypothetical protein
MLSTGSELNEDKSYSTPSTHCTHRCEQVSAEPFNFFDVRISSMFCSTEPLTDQHEVLYGSGLDEGLSVLGGWNNPEARIRSGVLAGSSSWTA